MSKPSRSLLHLLCVLFSAVEPAFAQSTISGKVQGTEGMALPGATALVIGTNNFTTTDVEGRFTLKAKPGDLIQFSFVGYQDFQVVLGNETALNIVLTEDTMVLDEVVVVGYGTALRKDVTGSVANSSKEEFTPGNITNPLQQIQGKIAGVSIVQPGGDPNGDFSVRIRGASSLEGQPPLLVVDGIAIDDFYTYIHSINPSDIETYDILKDASAAAIYGARGANGVVLITTKKGKAGTTRVDYQGFTSLEKVANQIDLLNAAQWREATAGMPANGLDANADTDWQKVITQTGYAQSHTVSISSGTEHLSFRGSVGYLKQQGVIKNTGKEMFSSRITANQKSFNDRLEISFGINTALISRNFLPDQISTSLSRTGLTQIPNYSNLGGQIFNIAMIYLPVWPVNNSDGSYYRPPLDIPNPSFIINEPSSTMKEFFFQSSAKADYEIVKGFKLGALGAISTGSETYDRFWPPLPGTDGLADATKSDKNKLVFTGDIHGNFQKKFGRHTVDVTGVYEYNNFVNDGFSVTASGMLIPELLTNNLGTATSVTTSGISSFKNEVRLISFLGRAVYNFDDRYLFTATFRRDGSSKFGPNNRWGNFPSFAFAWRASNESFLRDAEWLNLKVRISYGYTGNQENITPYNYQILYEPYGPFLYNGGFYQSYAVNQESNPDLKWEVRKSFNVGLDFSLWRDRVFGTFDVFSDRTDDLLFTYAIPQPPFLTNEVLANAASAVNKGMEITLGAVVITKRDLQWNITTNLSTVNNYITKLLGEFKGVPITSDRRDYGYVSGGMLGYAPVSKLEIGYPAGVFFIPQHAGFSENGEELFNNYDTQGNLIGTTSNYFELTDEDRLLISPTPDFSWGITNTVTYRNFDLSFFIRGVQGQKVYSNTLMMTDIKRYLEFGLNASDRALTGPFSNLPYPSTYWLMNASFARLENINLGYRFRNLERVQNLRIYLSANNLFVITDYDGVDPEVKTEGSQRNIDLNYYPKTRSFTAGIEIGF